MRQPFKTASPNVKEHMVALSGARAVVSVPGSPEHPTLPLVPAVLCVGFEGGGGPCERLPVISPITINSHR